MGHYKSICPSISEKEREELKAKQTKARRALVAEEAGPSDSVNQCDDQVTDDESDGNDFSYDMGLLAFDMEEEEEFNLMAMSESDSEIEEVTKAKLNTSSITLSHEQCDAGVTQEYWDDDASHLDDNELLHDHLELLKDHEDLLKVIARYMKDNTSLTNELVSLRDEFKGKLSGVVDVQSHYDNLLASHHQLERTVVECRSENNKLADLLVEKDMTLDNLKSELSDLTNHLTMVQGSERNLHIKLTALNKASNAIKYIEQFLQPSGCKEGIGYGSEITLPSTSAGTVFIKESFKETPIMPTVTSVVAGKGKEKVGLSEPSKSISKIQKKVSSGEGIQAKEHSCAKPKRIAYQPKKQIASKVESDIACKRIQKRDGSQVKSALRSKANLSKSKSVSFAPILFHPQFSHPFEDETPSTYIPPYFKVRKNRVFKDDDYYHYESTPDSYSRVTIPHFHKDNNAKAKRFQQKKANRSHSHTCTCIFETHSHNATKLTKAPKPQAASPLKPAKVKDAKSTNPKGPELVWVPKPSA